MNTLKKDKDSLRREYLEKRAGMDSLVKHQRDLKICSAATSLAGYRWAEYVLMYAPAKGEIDVMPIAYDALSKGKKVAFPRCNKENCTMDFHIVPSLDELQIDSYGLREPPSAAPIYDPCGAGDAICFVPGLVFDREGYRLGYGKGFYDRYLSNFKGNIVGIAYSDFIIPSVPRGKFDISINILLSEKGVTVTGDN